MEQIDLATMTPHKVLQAAFYLQRAWNETLLCDTPQEQFLSIPPHYYTS
jgi:hypothetical protein